MKDKKQVQNEQVETITEGQMEDVLDLMIRSGTIPDPRVDDEKARQAKQEKARKVYHNTLLLFQRYRDIIWVLQSFTTEVATELDQPLSDIDQRQRLWSSFANGETFLPTKNQEDRQNRLFCRKEPY